MNVSKEAREAAAILERATYLNADHPTVQAFAKFEAEITQRVRDEALEDAAKVAAETILQARMGEIDTDLRSIGHILEAAIRQMIGGKA